MPFRAEKDAVFTLPIRLVTSADKDVAATGKTLTVQLMKAGDASFTDVTSATTEAEIEDGVYTVAFTTSHTDTAGIAVIQVTATATDDYFERIEVVDYSAATEQPASLSSTERNSIADHVLRRTFDNARGSSDGDAAVGNEHSRTLLGASAAIIGERTYDSPTKTYEFWDDSGDTYPLASWVVSGDTTTPTVAITGA